MTRNKHLAKVFRQALRRSGGDASTIAWRAGVPRQTMARLLQGDEQVAFGSVGDVAFHLGLQVDLKAMPEARRQTGPIPTVVDLALRRVHGS